MKFLAKGFLFSLPILVVVGLPIWIFWQSGELLPNDAMVARRISGQEVLIGLAASNPNDYLNVRSVSVEHPDVIVLGSSRVEETRANFFVPSTTAYIASGAIQKASYFKQFLDAIPASDTPKIMIVALDEKFFNPNYDALGPDDIGNILAEPLSFSDALINWKGVYRDLLQGQISVAEFLHPTSSFIGLDAFMYGEGYRNDGSLDIGTKSFDPIQTTLLQVTAGGTGYEYSDASSTVSQKVLTELDAFLAEAQSRHIYVIGYIPPSAPEIYDALRSMPNQFGYLNALPSDLDPLFAKYNFNFYNFADPRPLGLMDRLWFDGVHTTERGSLMLFIKIAATDPILAKHVDIPFLKRALASSTSQYDLIGP